VLAAWQPQHGPSGGVRGPRPGLAASLRDQHLASRVAPLGPGVTHSPAKAASASPSPPTTPPTRLHGRSSWGEAPPVVELADTSASPRGPASAAGTAVQRQAAVEVWNTREPEPEARPACPPAAATGGGSLGQPQGQGQLAAQAQQGQPRARSRGLRQGAARPHSAPSAYLLRAPLQVRRKVDEAVFASSRLREGAPPDGGVPPEALAAAAAAASSGGVPVVRLCPWCGQARPEPPGQARRPEAVVRCSRCGRSFNPAQAKVLKWQAGDLRW